MINFNTPPCIGNEIEYIEEAIKNKKICGDGIFTKRCSEWMETRFNVPKVLLTTSCTHALEMSAILCNIGPGDEVIMPSFTFVSTANAFVMRGATVVFVDIRPDTMNMDESKVEDAITKRTKAIVVVHYAGVACEMNKIMEIAKRNKIFVIEDAAQGVMSTYNGMPLGSIGDFGNFSFHETKNYSMGEGGAILINDSRHVELAEIIREKGTDRSKFFRGQVDKYTWVEYGSSYLPSEINAAYLWAQLEYANEINDNRLRSWNYYHESLTDLEMDGYIQRPYIPEECTHNGHMYYIKVKDIGERSELIEYLKERDIMAVFHYIPLHLSRAGEKYGRFHGQDIYTSRESERLLRLPLYYNISQDTIRYITGCVKSFFKDKQKATSKLSELMKG